MKTESLLLFSVGLLLIPTSACGFDGGAPAIDAGVAGGQATADAQLPPPSENPPAAEVPTAPATAINPEPPPPEADGPTGSSDSEASPADEGAEPQGQLTRPPELLERVEPVYPPEAFAQRIEAQVVLRLTIEADGTVGDVAVMESGGPAFDEAAVEAARQLKFRSAEIDGVPAAIMMDYRQTFEVAEEAVEVPVELDQERLVGALRGKLLERGTRTPLAGVVVQLPTLGLEAITEADGRFEVTDVPAGEIIILIEDPAYYTIEDAELIVATQVTEVRYYPERRGYSDSEIVVVGKRIKKEVARHTLTVEEIRKIPGTSGDALKVVQNLPGVARAPFGAGLLVVRGSSPGDSGAVINRHFVPLIYHFGGLRSVFSSSLLESIDFYPGNFSPEFGRFSGGIVDARVRRPKTDRIHGHVEADFFDAGLLIEGPVGEKGAFAVAGRRSYIDYLFPLFIPDDANVDFTVAPRYYDYQLIYDWMSGTDRFRLFFFGSDDKLRFLLDEPDAMDPSVRGEFKNDTSFYRLYGAWNKRINDRITNELSLAVGLNSFFLTFMEKFYFDTDVYVITAREDLEIELSDTFKLRTGLDLEVWPTRFEIVATRPPKEGSAPEGRQVGAEEALETQGEAIIARPGLWIESQWKPVEALLLLPGMRFDYHHPVDEWSVDPRLNARYTLQPGTVIKGGVGQYSQPPQPDETDDVFGNTELQLWHAYHLMVGAEQALADAVTLDVQWFHKRLVNLVARVDDPNIKYNNQGTGRIYGIEVLLRHALQGRFFGWISYTLMRSERQDAPGEPYRLFDFDQTHILAAVAQYRLPANWEIGARWRYVTGNPVTLFSRGPYDVNADVFVGKPGEINATRLPAFHQLDLRVDRKWIWDLWYLTAYFEIQNVYNRQNPETYTYRYDFSDREIVSGLPILPSFGLRGSF